MAKRLLILAISGCFYGCGFGFHTVYIDRDSEVLTSGRAKCERAYSTWDGTYWIDFYGAPCNIFLKREGKNIKPYEAPYCRPRNPK